MRTRRSLTGQHSNRQLNNRGAALIMVIVVISFVSITATILLYMSAMNFYMKSTDKKTKESFYEGEAALEEIRGTMMAYASDAAKEAYFDVMADCGTTDPADMQKNFNNLFITKFSSKWKPVGMNTDDPAEVLAYLKTLIDSQFSSCLTLDTAPGSSPCSYQYTEGTFKLTDVRLSYTDSAGYTTIITTDFVVQAPGINFSMDPAAEAASNGSTIDLVDYVTYNNYTKR